MKNPSDIKIVNIISNINRGLDYWETIVEFYDIDSNEFYRRSYIHTSKLSLKELAEKTDLYKELLINEINNNIAKPEPAVQEPSEWQ